MAGGTITNPDKLIAQFREQYGRDPRWWERGWIALGVGWDALLGKLPDNVGQPLADADTFAKGVTGTVQASTAATVDLAIDLAKGAGAVAGAAAKGAGIKDPADLIKAILGYVALALAALAVVVVLVTFFPLFSGWARKMAV